jgi:hypothetical protein
MEQVGYMYRFHTTYCIQNEHHFNDAKCKKKQDKYAARLENAQDFLKKLQPSNVAVSPPVTLVRTVSVGGKRKTRKRVYRTRSSRRKH